MGKENHAIGAVLVMLAISSYASELRVDENVGPYRF